MLITEQKKKILKKIKILYADKNTKIEIIGYISIFVFNFLFCNFNPFGLLICMFATAIFAKWRYISKFIRDIFVKKLSNM